MGACRHFLVGDKALPGWTEGHVPLFRKAGVAVFLGVPVGFWGGGGYVEYLGGGGGGVMVLVCEGLTAEVAKLPTKRESDPVVWDAWHSSRWIHVRLALGDGHMVLHAIFV